MNGNLQNVPAPTGERGKQIREQIFRRFHTMNNNMPVPTPAEARDRELAMEITKLTTVDSFAVTSVMLHRLLTIAEDPTVDIEVRVMAVRQIHTVMEHETDGSTPAEVVAAFMGEKIV